MLTIKLDKDPQSMCLHLAGHAGAGKRGGDIVCAAASILTYTAAEEMLRLHREGILHTPPVIRLAPGVARIEAKTCRATQAAFSVIATGLHLLATQYPEFVKLETHERLCY